MGKKKVEFADFQNYGRTEIIYGHADKILETRDAFFINILWQILFNPPQRRQRRRQRAKMGLVFRG